MILLTPLQRTILTAYLHHGQYYKPTARSLNRRLGQIESAIAKLKRQSQVPPLDPNDPRTRLTEALNLAGGDIAAAAIMLGCDKYQVLAQCSELELLPENFRSGYPNKLVPNPDAPLCPVCGERDRVGKATSAKHPSRWKCHRTSCNKYFLFSGEK